MNGLIISNFAPINHKNFINLNDLIRKDLKLNINDMYTYIYSYYYVYLSKHNAKSLYQALKEYSPLVVSEDTYEGRIDRTIFAYWLELTLDINIPELYVYKSGKELRYYEIPKIIFIKQILSDILFKGRILKK